MRLRAALIGCGAMSRAWLDAAVKIENLEVVGLADSTRPEPRAARGVRAARRLSGDGHQDIASANRAGPPVRRRGSRCSS